MGMQGNYTSNIGKTDSLMNAELITCLGFSSVNSYPGDRCSYIIMQEECFFNECDNMPFYYDLLNSKICYSNDGEPGAVPYINYIDGQNVALQVGKVYCLDGVFYIVKEDGLTMAGHPKTKAPGMVVAPMFNNPAYEFLWCRYLRFVLAFAIDTSSSPNRWVSDTANGVVKKQSEGTTAADLKDFRFVLEKNWGLVWQMYGNMEKYIMRNPGAYPNYYKVKQNACEPCETSNTAQSYYGFNVD